MYGHLIYGQPRSKIAASLWEYRRFIADHPGESLSVELAEVSRCVRVALREQRRIARNA